MFGHGSTHIAESCRTTFSTHSTWGDGPKCIGAPKHFGMSPQQAVEEVIRLLRYGLLPRPAPQVNHPAGPNPGSTMGETL